MREMWLPRGSLHRNNCRGANDSGLLLSSQEESARSFVGLSPTPRREDWLSSSCHRRHFSPGPCDSNADFRLQILTRSLQKLCTWLNYSDEFPSLRFLQSLPSADPSNSNSGRDDDEESRLRRIGDLVHRAMEVHQILLLELELFKHRVDSYQEDLDREQLKKHIEVLALHVVDSASVLEKMRKAVSS